MLAALRDRLALRWAKRWHRRFVILLCLLNVVSLVSLLFAIVSVEEQHWTAAQATTNLRMARQGPHSYFYQPNTKLSSLTLRSGVRPAGQLLTTSQFPPSPADNTTWPAESSGPGGDCVWKVVQKSVPPSLPAGWKNSDGWTAVNQAMGTSVRASSIESFYSSEHDWTVLDALRQSAPAATRLGGVYDYHTDTRRRIQCIFIV